MFPSALAEGGLHVVGWGCGCGDRGVEREGYGAGEEVQPALPCPVDGVAEDGAAEGPAVDADLVGAAGSGAKGEPGEVVGAAEGLPFGLGGLSGGVGLHAPAGLAGDFQQGLVDEATFGCRGALDDGPVEFAGAALGEERLCGMQGGAAEGDDEASRGVGVEAVDEPGAVLAAGELGKPVLDRGAAAWPGVHRQARGFVQDDEALVLKQDVRHWGRLTAAALHRKGLHAR